MTGEAAATRLFSSRSRGTRTGTTHPRPRGGGRNRWRRGALTAALAVAVALLMLLHSAVPNGHRAFGRHLGSLLETLLPWLGLAVPLVLLLALVRRSATALVAAVLPAVVWVGMFGGLLLDKGTDGGNLMVAAHNVGDVNPDPAGTARKLAASGADVLALEEMTDDAARVYTAKLAGTYRYHAVQGSVGLWSTYPIREAKPLDVYGTDRTLRTVVDTPHGALAVYVVHLWSVRVTPRSGFTTYQRDMGADAVGRAVAADPVHRVVLLGDFNGGTDDRSLAPITSRMRSAQTTAGRGFGFTWPSSFPVVRIDQIMVRGVRATSSWTLPGTGSDHLPVAARLRL
ncbi:endonuclease/exonuclease/phosphatase family protein [Streptomyces sp. NPDC005722]